MKLMDRRTVLSGALVAAGAYGLVSLTGMFDDANARSGGPFKINRTPEEWKQRLGAARYRILRLEGTERAYSSSLNSEKRKGVYACAGCNLGLYSSQTKYDSGTGWPSFDTPVDGAVDTTEDRSHGMVRIECHCSRCGSHLGHVFPDGPPPSGLRYCINGVAMDFEPAGGVVALSAPFTSKAV